MALAEQPRLIAMALSESLRRLRKALGGGRGKMRMSGPAPERLILAPQDLYTVDPTVAQEIYSGLFHFAGVEIRVGPGGPFRVRPPSPEWEHELHSFSWLRHLEATGDAVSTRNAQALVGDWIELHAKPRDLPAWEAETTALRLIAWLCHSVMIVDGVDIAAYRRFMKAIGNHIRYLRNATSDAPEGLPKLVCLIALAYGDICAAGQRFGMRQAQRNLDLELVRQIYADGGHVSRNPALLPDILALLLPLRQSYARAGQTPSMELVSAIDRMMPALRFFRHPDGTIARFNGAGPTPQALLATVLRYDDSLGEPPPELPMSGYQRIAAGGTCLIADTGKTPSGELSERAHAGTLAFEFSADGGSLVVNCGVPVRGPAEALKAARTTAAHSTATIDDTSSSRFAVDGMMGRLLDSRIVQSPSSVTCFRGAGDTGPCIEASHDGYARPFGVTHERRLELAQDGSAVFGEDRFPLAGKGGGEHEVAIRFHLHPSVRAEAQDDGHTVLLSRAGKPTWRFACTDVQPSVEESVFFAVPGGARRTAQIVLRFDLPARREAAWLLQRLEQA